MERRIALKRLTASDLTLFAWHFHNQNAGNQKAINLNTDVFITTLFPALPDAVSDLNGQLPLDLSIYGPGVYGLHNLQRKIVKRGAYKNWRLNGENIHNPDDEPDRYNNLRPGDLAVFEFSGRVVPTSAKLVLVSQAVLGDRPIYDQLSRLLGDKSMVAVSGKQLQEVADELERDAHPFFELTLDAELEDAAQGGAAGRTALWRRPAAKGISRDELEQARRRAEEIGRIGEELVFGYLQQEQSNGLIAKFVWQSDVNAVAPYDFSISLPDGTEIVLDVKATSGAFNRTIHISISELIEMARRQRYDLYRIFGVDDGGGSLRIMTDSATFATSVLEQFRDLPPSVRVDGVSVEPESLPFGPTIALTRLIAAELE